MHGSNYSMSIQVIDCPKCGKRQATEQAEEVDIGVGIQRHVYGYECPDCGLLVKCDNCGGIDNDHMKWCKEGKWLSTDNEPPNSSLDL